jgi:SAM-dependent methyltransferase
MAGMSDASERDAMRRTFESVAHLYDGRRPALPADLYDTIVELSGVPDGGRVLEVGAGTGRATVPMAARGYRITAVELGARLAAILRRNLAGYPDVEVVVADFDTWSTTERFDLILALDAWHWLDPETRTAKAATLLRDGGAAATVFAHHVAGGDTEFFHDTQVFYRRYMPGTPPDLRLTEPDDFPSDVFGFGSSPDFEEPVLRRWVTVAEYTTASFIELLETFSSHIALPDADRAALFAGIADLAENRYGGRIRRATLTELCIARRRPRAAGRGQPPGGV